MLRAVLLQNLSVCLVTVDDDDISSQVCVIHKCAHRAVHTACARQQDVLDFAQLDTLAAINQAHYKQFTDPEILARIQQHELAYRMQTSVPELMDLTGESDATFEL